eukprot:CAMPEP_0172529076 /NCGR_PEP_ID=MMETSP1067-20121228/3247_1 /TAXON_ID=265564 ORGANISM="Thalassiosira punctigera, Strain Tpunct2005C2" /NCGR_SAMPLE_ID=MMETSP1067 /ASSEMBLY_ACC=CAM_ASM_000444 /LENGTH=399 /DNA_ID=CAMNT_0013313065 /DNA_START=26 /DNA_END=1225 /DNA_ORIENTATION=+
MGAPNDNGDDDRDSDKETSRGGNGRKLGLIILLAFVAVLSVARQVAPMTMTRSRSNSSSGEHVRAISAGIIATTSRIPAKAYNLSPFINESASNSSSALRPTTITPNTDLPTQIHQGGELSTTSLPIYLLDLTSNQTAQTTWGILAERWNRTTQYGDLFEMATSVPSLPSPVTISVRRTVVMIHCGPKTGSTTLRKACKLNLIKTCEGMELKKGQHYPEGYMDEDKLYPLIRRCTNTSHFCAKEIDMPPSFGDVPPFGDVTFVHMFPFRNYDDWAASALKQAYDRSGERGCKKTGELLERCEPSRMEIDFRKYGKTELSRFKEGVMQRMREGRGEDHMFLLYYHRELNQVLERLSDAYGVPLLPGADGKGKEKRRKGTCNAKLLRKFHNCFSSELMNLL